MPIKRETADKIANALLGPCFSALGKAVPADILENGAELVQSYVLLEDQDKLIEACSAKINMHRAIAKSIKDMPT